VQDYQTFEGVPLARKMTRSVRKRRVESQLMGKSEVLEFKPKDEPDTHAVAFAVAGNFDFPGFHLALVLLLGGFHARQAKVFLELGDHWTSLDRRNVIWGTSGDTLCCAFHPAETSESW
jgi:hypothetical protein